MKNWKKILCLAAAALALTMLTACGGLLASAFNDQKQGQQLAQQVSQAVGRPVTYSAELQRAAYSIASWAAGTTAVREEDGELRRTVDMGLSAGSYGHWMRGDLNNFLYYSDCYAAGDTSLTLAFRAEESPLQQSVLLYFPKVCEAGQSLADYAGSAGEMGAAFLQYGEETYVVAVFR